MSKAARFIIGTALMFVGSGSGQLIARAIGFNLISSVIFEPKVPKSRRLPEQSVLLRSATEPQPVVYGTVKKSGVVVWMDSHGEFSKYLTFVIALAGHEVDGYETVWINGTPIDVATEINGSGFVTKSDFVDSDGNNLVKVTLYDGTQTTVDSDLNASFGSYFTADAVGEGVAYAVIRCEIDQSTGGNDPDNPEANVWANGAPGDIQFTVRGKKVYDPRLDSTNGGSGTHRTNDPSTWAYSDNPVLCIRDYLTDERLGGAFSHAAIDDAVVITQANICEESVSVPDGSGGTENQDRYTCNGYVSTADSPRENIQKMLTSCMGAMVYTGGLFKIYAGAYPAASHAIDETWLRGAVSGDAATSRTNLYNAVRGTYVSADEQYKRVEFEPRISSTYETSDGRRRWADIDLPFTKNEYEDQRIALTHLKKSRNQVVLSLQCNRKAMAVGLWETVTLSLSEFQYNAKTFRVVAWNWNPDRGVDLTLREEESDDWTYSAPDLDEVSFGNPVPATVGGPPPPTSLTATPVSYGTRLDWDNPNMSGISHIEVWRSETNNRASATLAARLSGDSFTSNDLGFFWIIAKGLNNLYSTWHPTSSTGGVDGTVEILPSPEPHTHSYLPLSGGTLTGTLNSQSAIPTASNAYDLGSSANPYRIVHVRTSIELGAASDTTVTRKSAGTIAVEGDALFSHASSSYTSAKVTFSTSAPTGGANGDIWFRYS